MRICTKPIQLDLGKDKNVEVEPGTTVMVPAFQYHHDDAFYPEASEFKPDRFENGAASGFNKRGFFLPFGDGPRICLGESDNLRNLFKNIILLFQNIIHLLKNSILRFQHLQCLILLFINISSLHKYVIFKVSSLSSFFC